MNIPFGYDPVCIHCGSKKRDGLRVAELQRQRDELLAALNKYGEHLHTCDCVVYGEIPDGCDDEHDVCTCGFSAAISNAKGGAA